MFVVDDKIANPVELGLATIQELERDVGENEPVEETVGELGTREQAVLEF